MNIGNRIYYKESDGTVIFQTGEISGVKEERSEVDEIRFIDIPFGAIDYTNTIIVDVEDGKPILKSFEKNTPEMQRIYKLEDELLLQSENETGGIL